MNLHEGQRIHLVYAMERYSPGTLLKFYRHSLVCTVNQIGELSSLVVTLRSGIRALLPEISQHSYVRINGDINVFDLKSL